MYDKRIKIFIGISLALLLVWVLRLLQMQLLAGATVQNEIERLKDRRGQSRQFKTLRGRILDRHGEVIAADMPRFQIYINYRLSRYLDERVVQAKLARARRKDAGPALYDIYAEVDDRQQDLQQIIRKCAAFGASRAELEENIRRLNDSLWNFRATIAWVRNGVDPNLEAQYGGINSIPASVAMADLERRFPDPNERCQLVVEVDDIPEMEKELPLVELQTEDDIFAAQHELAGLRDVQLRPTGHRYYPYGSTAAQTIGWVGPAQKRDQKLFAGDPLSSYLQGEVCGREDGVEYVCESILRGRRGEKVYDIDRRLVRETQTRFGRDVQVTLDIRLQQQIEQRLSDPGFNPLYHRSPLAAVVIDIASGDILALVSLPSYDLNEVRRTWGDLIKVPEPNIPLINRTINRLYPPGSVIKPLVLIAGLEAGVITPQEVISCPSQAAPAGWPDCLIFQRHNVGHDNSWANNARNALKGSCNIYFSHLADRLEPRLLQQWLYRFGYGHSIPLQCPGPAVDGSVPRCFNQASGQIGSTSIYADIESFDQIPPLWERHRPLFGIGHGNFRVTPLQVADSFATLARGGRRKLPRLFLEPRSPGQPEASAAVDRQLSPTSLRVTREGMSAVVNERGGTAFDAFGPAVLAQEGVKVYGKTGSTEPANAWFGGFAEDHDGPKIAVAVVVEGGQHGSSDAAPLGREILQLCVEAGYLGRRPAAR